MLSDFNVFWLAMCTLICLTIGWVVFFAVAARNKENVRDLLEGNFLQMITVILIVAATAVLAAATVLSGEVAGSILSGVVGYVLGTVKGRSGSTS